MPESLPPSPHTPCVAVVAFSDGRGRIEVCNGAKKAWVHLTPEECVTVAPHPDYHPYRAAQ